MIVSGPTDLGPVFGDEPEKALGCDFCEVEREGHGARWLMNELVHTASVQVGGTTIKHQVRRPPGVLWVCGVCAPLVRDGDVEAVLDRARSLSDPGLSRLEHGLLLKALFASLARELAPTADGRPSPEDREAFAVVAAAAGANGLGEPASATAPGPAKAGE